MDGIKNTPFFFYRYSIFTTSTLMWSLQMNSDGYYLQTDQYPFDIQGYYFSLYHPNMADDESTIYPHIRNSYYYYHPIKHIYMHRVDDYNDYKIYCEPYI